MGSKEKWLLPLFLAFFLVSAVSDAHGNNNGEVKMTNNDINEITYHFGDASVPPRYHRSYTIKVTAGSIRIVVDSYGEVLADKEYEIAPEQFNAIKRSLAKSRIKNCALDGEDGCTGGTSESISYVDNQGNQFSGSIYHCGGKNAGNLCGDVTRFAEDVKRLIPDLSELTS
jgi:hypothetical protein